MVPPADSARAKVSPVLPPAAAVYWAAGLRRYWLRQAGEAGKPPAARTTPFRALSSRGTPWYSTTAPVTRPSSIVRRCVTAFSHIVPPRFLNSR